MKQILVIDIDFKKYSTMKEKLEEHLNVEITTAKGANDAIHLIEILPDLDFIIYNGEALGVENLTIIEDYLIEEKLNTLILKIGICPSNREQTLDLIKKVNDSLDSENFLKYVKEIFLNNDLIYNKKTLPNFSPVDFYFISNNQTVPFPFDFYLRIKQNADDFQYIKILNALEIFTPEDILKYKKYNLRNLYIRSCDYESFLKHSLKMNLKDHKPKDHFDKKYQYHLSKESLALLGINNETQELVHSCIKSMTANMDSNESIALYLKQLLNNPDSYSYVRSNLLGLILIKVVSKFDWDSRLIKDKIIYISFFHDISLINDEYCKIHSKEELYEELNIEYEFQSKSKIREKKFTSPEIDLIQQHALKSAMLFEKAFNIPPGVFQVIKEHHGSKNGIGFNNSQSISLQPLSMIFIVVEDFIVEFLKINQPQKNDVINILNNLKEKYIKGNYKKTVEILIQLLN